MIRGVLMFVFSVAMLALTVGVLDVATRGGQGDATSLAAVGAFTAGASGTLLYLTRRR